MTDAAAKLPAVLDIEASGFGRGSYPIEIGVVLPDGASHCHLIRPEPEWTRWDASAEAVHGIPRHVIEERGRPVGEVAQVLNLLLEGQTLYSDAWSFDNSWLSLLYYHAGVPQMFRLEALTRLLNEAQMDAWADTKAAVMAELGLVRHRASSDARILQQTYQRSALREQAAD